MKIKSLLIALSIIGFLSFVFTSCSKDDEMGIGLSSGDDPHAAKQATPIQSIDSIAISNTANNH